MQSLIDITSNTMTLNISLDIKNIKKTIIQAKNVILFQQESSAKMIDKHNFKYTFINLSSSTLNKLK